MSQTNCDRQARSLLIKLSMCLENLAQCLIRWQRHLKNNDLFSFYPVGKQNWCIIWLCETIFFFVLLDRSVFNAVPPYRWLPNCLFYGQFVLSIYYNLKQKRETLLISGESTWSSISYDALSWLVAQIWKIFFFYSISLRGMHTFRKLLVSTFQRGASRAI